MRTAVSMRSFSVVPVPCALTKSTSRALDARLRERAADCGQQPAALGVGGRDVRAVARARVAEEPAQAWTARVTIAGHQDEGGGLAEQKTAPASVEGPHALARERAKRVESRASRSDTARRTPRPRRDRHDRRGAGPRRRRVRWRPRRTPWTRSARGHDSPASGRACARGCRRARRPRGAHDRPCRVRARAPPRPRAPCPRRRRSGRARRRGRPGAAGPPPRPAAAARRGTPGLRPGAASATCLISPARPTRRSSTRNRSIVEMPSRPATRPDQNVSRSAPIGVTTPAARMATGSARRRVRSRRHHSSRE